MDDNETNIELNNNQQSITKNYERSSILTKNRDNKSNKKN
jgi:hypothetical protein